MLAVYRASIIAVVLALAACGASQHERTVKSTFVGLNAARDGFIVWDAEHQKNIVDSVGSFEDGKVVLSAYRTRREPVISTLAAAYRAVATAAIDTSDMTVADAIAAAIEVYEAIELLTGRPAKTPP